MKYLRAKKGPVRHQPYYSLDEIEQICSTELRNVGLLPLTPEPIRIDRFIEKKYGDIVNYEDLEKNILGFSRFGPRGVDSIVVSELLDQAAASPAERRLRTTLAHECGHCLLHAHLFIGGKRANELLGKTQPSEPKILCRDIPGMDELEERKKYTGDWWEFQANKAMASLLLPKILVQKAVQPYLEEGQLKNDPPRQDGDRLQVEKALADVFNVNPIVIRLRLNELFPSSPVE